MSETAKQPAKKNTILDQIGRLNDKEQLTAILQAAQARLEALEKGQKEVHLALRKGEWVATTPPVNGRRKTIAKLGPKLSPAAVLEVAAEKSPEKADFELPKIEGATQRQQEPDKVSWWEDEGGNRRYYDRPAYDQVKAAWDKRNKLANDPLALAYGLSGEAVEKLRQLEAEGYRLVWQE
jgi:hypothetical protein